jgi:hypothetical protein
MTASGTVRQRTPHGQALRRLISRHPMATFLLQVFSISGMAVFGQPPQRAARTASTEGSPILLAKGDWS